MLYFYYIIIIFCSYEILMLRLSGIIKKIENEVCLSITFFKIKVDFEPC